MKVILEKIELDWLGELRNQHMCSRYLLRAYDAGNISAEEFVKRFRITFAESDTVLADLAKSGV